MTIFTVIINAILDPLFIYVFKWGIQGAAVATIISQTLALCWTLKIFSDKNLVIHFKRGIYKLKARIVKDVISIGMAPFFMNSAACLIVILINQGLQHHGGDLAIGAYGIVNRVSFVFVMIVLGINQGMQPIVGFNYGAKQYKRTLEALKLTIICATAVTTTGFLLAELFPRAIAMVFTTDEELIQHAIVGMRIVFFCFPIIGFQIVAGNFFQSVGKVNKSIFLSLTRQVLFLIPLLIILPRYMGENGVWYSIPIADFISGILAIILLKQQFNHWNNPAFASDKVQK